MFYIPLIILVVALFAFVAIAFGITLRIGRIHRASVIRHVAFVVRRNLPLVSSLFVASNGLAPGVRLPMRRLSRLLELGIPLSEAIGMSLPECPRVDLSILRAAEQAGTLPDAVTIVNERYRRQLTDQLDRSTPPLLIPVFTLTVCLLELSFLAYRVWPKYVVIFDDFDTRIPNFSHEIVMTSFFGGPAPTTWYGMLFHGMALAAIGIVVLGIFWGLLGSTLKRFQPFRTLLDRARWMIPTSHRTAIAKGCVDTLPTLRLATSAGWPLDRAIDLAASIDTNIAWKHKLTRWAETIRSGVDPIAAGMASRLPGALVRYLAIGVRDADLEAPLYAAEQYYILLYERQSRALRLAFAITAMLALGVFVGCICVATILMVVQITNSVEMQWYLI